MNATFEHIILKDELSQSELFGEYYDEMLDYKDAAQAFTDTMTEDVGELLNNILFKYPSLAAFQRDMLGCIFNEFNKIRMTIDPKRLKSFEHYLNDDGELLLYRKTENSLINIIINPEDCIAFSSIPHNPEINRQLYFIYPNGDFETLAYRFFTN
jgi:hypothetical protein